MNSKAIDAICTKAIELIHYEEPRPGVLTHYWTDILHDIKQLNGPNAPDSFLWCARKMGTHLFPYPLPDKDDDPYNIRGSVRFVANQSMGDNPYLWYLFTADCGLIEISHSDIMAILEATK